MNLALILALAVAIVAVVFAFQNPQEVQVQFLSLRSVPASLSLVLLVTFTFGLLTGWLGSLPARLRARREARAAQKERERAMGTLNSATLPASGPTMATGTTEPADPYAARFGAPKNP